MALNWPTFFTRLGSAIVFCIIMMAGLLWNSWAFLALVALIMVLCLRDYFRLMPKVIVTSQAGWVAAATIAFALVLLALVGYQQFYVQDPVFPGYQVSLRHLSASYVRLSNGRFWVATLFAPILILMLAVLSKKNLLFQGLTAVGGLVYIVMPCVMLLFMYRTSWVLPLALILMIWTNDTMAYLVGSFIGKTPFSPISPKKTWEGTAGGALLTITGAAVWSHYASDYHMIDWMFLALCAAVAGTAGDLLESKLKRMANVKDSGTMMPGHGGALDRFDSLLVATPFAFCYVYLFM